jgi:hypothetical protein
VERRYELQAKNEALLRTVNDRISALDAEAGWADPEHLFDFQCECGNPDGCDGRVPMSLPEYDNVRTQRDRFAVLPGHENDAIEDVVERTERYYIVDKHADVEHLVE